MAKIIEYDVVFALESFLLVNEINELIKSGWQPLGSIFIDKRNLHVQTVVKYETPSKDFVRGAGTLFKECEHDLEPFWCPIYDNEIQICIKCAYSPQQAQSPCKHRFIRMLDIHNQPFHKCEKCHFCY
jgi:hypothetical protein